MSDPLVEQIAENVKDTIALITTDNSFNQTLIAVRPSRSDIQTPWDDLTALINQVEAEALTPGNGTVRWRQYFLIVVLLRDSDTDTSPIDTRRNQVRADVEKKLAEDLSRNNLANNTEFHEATPFDADQGGLGGIALKISVDYSTEEDDPYTKG